MLERTIFILAKSQEGKTGTNDCARIDFDMAKNAIVALETLALALEKGTDWHSKLFGNIMAFPAVFVGTLDTS